MEAVQAERGDRRLILVGIAAGLAQVAVAVAVTVADPELLDKLIRNYGVGFVIYLLPAALASVPIRWLVDWRRGQAPLAGTWASVMTAKVMYQLAMLVAVPVLSLAGLVAWLAEGPANTLLRAWILLFIASAVVEVTGTLIGNILNLLTPRGRPA